MMYNKVITNVLSAHTSAQGTNDMSERTKVRPNFDDPDHNNDNANSGEVSTYDPNRAKKFRRRLVIGASATAAGMTAAAVFGLGMNSHNNTEAPQARPTAAAGATPGEKVSATATAETSPTAETSIDKMTLDNFDYVVDGKHYVGQEALKEGFGISAEQYGPSDGKAIAEAFFAKLTEWQNLPETPEQAKLFKDYASADGHGGIGAMNVDFINPAFINALSGTPPEGANTAGITPPDEWMRTQATFVNEASGNRYVADLDKKPGDEPYKLRQVIDKSQINVHGYTDNLISLTVPVVLTDNGDKNAVGRERLAAPEGFNGVTTANMRYANTDNLSFMINPKTNTWDLVSVVTIK
ncbi:MAG: hypothetical protein JWP06_1104 [Candidatus Saccharibacteria bacterium]|nr:hypothetical protein [Candidatus Saccharibacteria bacterium]